MAGSGKSRALWSQVFKKFVDSFKPKQSTKEGYLVGSDLNGNKFYEVPAEPEKGKRNPRRWFTPEQEMNFDVKNMSAEWDAWLRNRRSIPPTIEELMKNQAIAEMKKVNAGRLKLKDGKEEFPALFDAKHSSSSSFPQYKDFDAQPGKGAVRFNKEDSK